MELYLFPTNFKTILLYVTMGTESYFPGVKRPGRGADHPPPSKCRGHERVELYLYSTSGPSWPVIERNLPSFIDVCTVHCV